MSTRATYQFNLDESPPICFYVHHDGYPSGAAEKLLPTLINRDSGGMAESFLMASSKAKFIYSHDSVGGTEFRYTVSGTFESPKLSYSSRIYGDDLEDWVVLADDMPLNEFIAEQLAIDLFKLDFDLGVCGWFTANGIQTELMRRAGEAQKRFDNGHGAAREVLELESVSKKLSTLVGDPNLYTLGLKIAAEMYIENHKSFNDRTMNDDDRQELIEIIQAATQSDMILKSKLQNLGDAAQLKLVSPLSTTKPITNDMNMG